MRFASLTTSYSFTGFPKCSRLYAYRIKADNGEIGADGCVNRLVPRFAGFGKGFGSRAERGIAKKVFPTTSSSLIYGGQAFDLDLCAQSEAVRTNGASGREPVLLKISHIDLIH